MVYNDVRGIRKVDVVSGQQMVQKWGNSLAVRITGAVAETAGFVQGLPITAEVVEGGILLKVSGEARMSLPQMLAAYDPEAHRTAG